MKRLIGAVLCGFLIFGIISIFIPSDATAEPMEEWITEYNIVEGSYDMATDLVLDSRGNTFVTGWSYGGETGEDITTIKYDPQGNVVWAARYNDATNGNERGQAITIDSNGNVCVTGYSEWGFPDSKGDYITIKYDQNGNELWVNTYNGPGNGRDYSYSIGADSSGNVFVTGKSEGIGTNCDYATIAYDDNGTQLWMARYNGPIDNSDGASDLSVDSQGYIYVTGYSKGTTHTKDYTTIKYDPNGNELWVARYNGPENRNEIAAKVTLDSAGNVYITGSSRRDVLGGYYYNDYITIKYDSNGNEHWVAIYYSPGSGPVYGDGGGKEITVDPFGNVYVTGGSSGSGTDSDYTTIKYDSEGNNLWVARYNGPENNYDIAYSLAIDSYRNVYVTGWSYNIEANPDIASIAYDTDGNELWVARYGGQENGYNFGSSIAVDSNGNILVTGFSGPSEDVNITTIKYSPIQPSNNHPPVAHAGPDQTLYIGATVEFSGIRSYDLDVYKKHESTDALYPVREQTQNDEIPSFGQLINNINSDSDYHEIEDDFNIYFWDFGDGTQHGRGINPSHIYHNTGIYTVILVIMDRYGATSQDTCTIIILPFFQPPIAKAGADQRVNRDDIVYFDAGDSYDLNGHELTFRWDFGDGSSDSNVINPSHIYENPGIYVVTVTVMNLGGETATDNCLIYVNAVVTADAGPDITVYEKDIVYFDASYSSGLDDNAISYEWDFDAAVDIDLDGDYSNDKEAYESSPTHIYDSPGEYLVTLTVSDGYSSSTDILTVTVLPNIPPIADAGSDRVVNIKDFVHFDGSDSYDPNDHIIKFSWDFGDGTIHDNIRKPVHDYDNHGWYTVTLTVTDSYGDSSSDSCNIYVNAYPFADAGPDITAYEGDIVEFDGRASHDPDTIIELYMWDFDSNLDSDGDGDPGNDADATGYFGQFMYTTEGQYQIILTVSDGFGTSLDTITVTVLPKPQSGEEIEVEQSEDVGNNSIDHDNKVDIVSTSSIDPDEECTSVMTESDNPENPAHQSNLQSTVSNEVVRKAEPLAIPQENDNTDVESPIPEAVITVSITSILLSTFSVAAPLYMKTQRKDLLKNRTRKSIYEHISTNPGGNFNSIKDILGLTNGVLTYHLKILEREDFITSKRIGGYKRFYITGDTNNNDIRLKGLQKDIITIIKKSPGISQTDIAEQIGATVQVINYHIKRLHEKGIITINIANGHRSQCFIN